MINSWLSKKRVAIILATVFCLAQAKWISFKQSEVKQAPDVTVVSSNEFTVALNLNIKGVETEIIDTKEMLNTNNETFVFFMIPECYQTGDIGKPNLPVIKKTIGVPHNARIEVNVTHGEYKEISLQYLGFDQRIMPVLAPVIKLPGQKPRFEIDQVTYSQNAYYPYTIARIVSDDIMRGYRLAVIEIAPIQYNPVTKSIRFYTNLEIRIEFIGVDMLKTKQMVAQDYSPLFNDFMKKRVLNYSLYEHLLRGVPPLPIHYLIVTHNTFQDKIQPLANYYKKMGFKVKIANQDSLATWTTTAIRTFISNQSPMPTFVTLVGDENGYLPAFAGSAILNEVTDLYYAEMDFSGYLPDLGIGRLPCADTTEAKIMVNKILSYRRAQFTTMSWIEHGAFCAGDDYYWLSEGTHNYCTSNFMDPHGYTTHKLYEVTYGATSQDVINTLNNGVSIITMSGHGYEHGWDDGPTFTTGHLTTITNGDMLPIATGHACYTNDFHIDPGFGEVWLKRADGGGIAYYGASCFTYWGEDDWLEREWYEAIYVDSLFEHSRFTQDGMYDGIYMSGSGFKQYYYEMYNICGDPSLDLWTDIPENMTVSHDPMVIPGTSDFTVTVKGSNGIIPLRDALVCCWIASQSPELHSSDYTDASGSVTLSISPTTIGDSMYVTATKHNYIPYEGYATVISSSGPYLVMGSTVVDDGGDGFINPGETIDFGVWVKNIGFDPASGAYGLLDESDSYISLGIDSSWFGNISSLDSAFSNPDYEFSVANNCPNSHIIQFDLEFHDTNDSLWTSHPELRVYAPVLAYQFVAAINGNDNGILDPGEIADLFVVLKNKGDATAPSVTGTLTTDSPLMTINDASGSFGSIDPDSSGNNLSDLFTVAPDISIPFGTPIDFSLIVEAGVYLDTIDFVVVVGQSVPTDTGYYYAYYSNGQYVEAPVFDWFAIDSTQSTNPGVSLDLDRNETVIVDLPFTFKYYGIDYNRISICSNGWIAMDSTGSTDFSNTGIPNTDGPEAMIAGMWDYLHPGAADAPGDIYYYYDATNHRFIVEYFQIDHYPNGDPETFEIILHDPAYYTTPTGDGEIIVQYPIGMQKPSSITIGIENVSEDVGIEYFFNGDYDSLAKPVTDSFAIKYTTEPPTPLDIEEYDEFISLPPSKTMLGVVYPNPFSRAVKISYQVSQGIKVNLAIYDVSGRLVRTFKRGMTNPGYYKIVWYGKDDAGCKTPAGIYFVRFNTGDYTKIEKVVLIK